MLDNPEKKQNPCPAWVWLILLAGLILLYLLFNHATSKKALWIQEDIQTRIKQNFSHEAELSNISIRVDGRDVTLAGSVSGDEIMANALSIASQTKGVRVISNDISLAPSPLADIGDMNSSAQDKPEPQLEKSPVIQAKLEPLPDQFAPLDEDIRADHKHSAQEEIAKQTLSKLDFSNITFEKNSTALTSNAETTLDKVVIALLENPTVSIRVDGHTDSSGNSEVNLTISKQRAQSVLDYLVNAGIDENRVDANGYGDQFPIAPNDTEAGRIKNRRIEIKVKNGE